MIVFNITKKLLVVLPYFDAWLSPFLQLDGYPKPNDRTVTRICTIDSTLVQYMHLLLISSLHIPTCIYEYTIYIYMILFIQNQIYWCCTEILWPFSRTNNKCILESLNMWTNVYALGGVDDFSQAHEKILRITVFVYQ